MNHLWVYETWLYSIYMRFICVLIKTSFLAPSSLGKEWIERGLKAIEAKVTGSTKKYLFTDHVTVAEACLIPQLYNARRFNVDLTQFPRLLAVEAACEKLQAFKDAHPDAQPDANQI